MPVVTENRRKRTAELMNFLLVKFRTQAELAQFLGISAANVSRWIKGGVIQSGNATNISNRLGIEEQAIEDFLSEKITLKEALEKKKDKPSISQVLGLAYQLDPADQLEIVATLVTGMSQELKSVQGSEKKKTRFNPDKLRHAIDLTCKTRKIDIRQIAEDAGIAEDAIEALLVGELPEDKDKRDDLFQDLAGVLIRELTPGDDYCIFGTKEALEHYCEITNDC